MQTPPRDVHLVTFPGFELLDLAGPLDVLAGANRLAEHHRRPTPYRTTVLGPTESLTSASGLALHVRPFRTTRRAPHTLLLTGGLDLHRGVFPPRDLAWLRRRAHRAHRVVSICTGAFLLAQLDLLDGRRATTHWLYLDLLRQRAPLARIEDAPLYVEDRGVWTSAGISTGIDLTLALVERDLGHEFAVELAQLLVLHLHRPGGQSQFSKALHTPAPSTEALRRACRAVLDDPSADHRVERLAERAHLSPRHFARQFQRETGHTPGHFVRTVRLDAARHLLEATDLPLRQVALRIGFSTEESLRRAFLQTLHVTPGAYRRRFGPSPAT